MDVPGDEYLYGIVIDAGSSGSRVQIYKWPDTTYVLKSKDSNMLESPPKITQEKDWTKKTSPGISTYGPKLKSIWPDHLKELMEYAELIIPIDKQAETPVFLLATAGMRLLKSRDQKAILKKTCHELRKNTKFNIRDCDDNVQIIDGETEGIYGWLALNYLMGQLDNYNENGVHESIGFMDMGGASTQIAFVPSSPQEIEKHRDDISKVTVRNINGITQQWDVFVETWLGFGANQARGRYLTQLVNLSPGKSTTLSDPCMPKDTESSFHHEGITYNVKGIGNYETCVKTIYPLLLKNLPCKEEPCLFNGVHGPKLNFDKDKFIGVSEYWYTANDVFQSGGEYNYRAFNEKVKEFCELDWSTILSNAKDGKYSNLDPDAFLKDACFKASWVINVLHEGFELPRLDVEVGDKKDGDDKDITKAHVPFKSTDSIDGNELSWTLGKMLLYASSEISPKHKGDQPIGVYPSEISGKKFVPAGGSWGGAESDNDDDDDTSGAIFPILVFALIAFGLFQLLKHRNGNLNRKFGHFKKLVFETLSKVPYLDTIVDAQSRYNEINQEEHDISLEEGTLQSTQNPGLTQLRTRSTMNLNEMRGIDNDEITTNFLNKPFVLPPKRSPVFFHSQNNSRESLGRTNSSLQKN